MLAALYSGSTIALNSVAGEAIDLRLAVTGVSPTIILASPPALTKYHEEIMGHRSGFLDRINHTLHHQTLEAGNMPQPTPLSKLVAGSVTAIDPAFKDLRLIYARHDTADPAKATVSSQVLADLRVVLGARIVYALTAPGVAGAVTQTNVYDYRKSKGPSHFGVPLSCVEIKLVGDETDIARDNPQGKV